MTKDQPVYQIFSETLKTMTMKVLSARKTGEKLDYVNLHDGILEYTHPMTSFPSASLNSY